MRIRGAPEADVGLRWRADDHADDRFPTLTTASRYPDIPSTTLDVLGDPLPGHLTVLDVREPEEWAHGHIEGALHVPLTELPNRRQDLPEGQLLVVCKIGGRSLQATQYLTQQGIDAVNLEGGMIEWALAGRPMLSENGRDPQVV